MTSEDQQSGRGRTEPEDEFSDDEAHVRHYAGRLAPWAFVVADRL